jgi:hypothetical protein
MTDKMKTALREALLDGERILWESGVQRFGIFDGREGRGILIRWLICVTALTAMAAAYAVHSGKGIIFYLVIAFALAIIIASPILSYRQTAGQRYYITNRRALTLRPDGAVFAMQRANVGEARLYRLDCGGVALSLGSMLLAEKDRQLRWRANHPMEASDYAITGMVFYRPENAEAALRLLEER